MGNTITVSMRIPTEELERMEDAARAMDVDRATLLKMALHSGYRNLMLEHTIAAYRRGEISLSKAAELNDISVYEIITYFDKFKVEFNFGEDDLETDLMP